MPGTTEDLFRNGARLASEPEEFAAKLAKGRPLRVKYGIDPTNPSVHLGHTVPLRLLRRFQERGHDAVLIIGDYTATIGDPSGRSEARKPLEPRHVQKNLAGYLTQIGRFIDLSRTLIYHNSSWFHGFRTSDWIDLCSQVTVQQLLSRDDFHKRVRDAVPVWVHEILYPMMQAYDSVRVDADVEVGGTEQLHTLMLARDLQKRSGQEPQACVTVPILRGTDGHRRMGKSLGNFVGVNDPPAEIYGKVMSIPDDLLDEWCDLLDKPRAEHPFECKKALALALAAECHAPEAATAAQAEWHARFADDKDPVDIPEVSFDPPSSGSIEVCPLLVRLGLATSNSDAKRLIVPASGVRIGPYRCRVTDPQTVITLQDNMVVRVGKKRIVRLKYAKEGSHADSPVTLPAP